MVKLKVILPTMVKLTVILLTLYVTIRLIIQFIHSTRIGQRLSQKLIHGARTEAGKYTGQGAGEYSIHVSNGKVINTQGESYSRVADQDDDSSRSATKDDSQYRKETQVESNSLAAAQDDDSSQPTTKDDSQYRKETQVESDSRRVAQIIICAVVSRLAICIFVYFFSVLFSGEMSGFISSYRNLWDYSDAPHYVNIAENWYQSVGEDNVLIVFLPLYPILIRLFALLFRDYFLSGVIISQISFVLSCILVYKVSRQLNYDEEKSFLSAKYMMLFPASFFVCSTFSESLFMLLSLLCIYFILKNKWVISALFGMLAAFTRYYGLLLAIPFAVEYIQTYFGADTHMAQTQTGTPAQTRANEPAQTQTGTPARTRTDVLAQTRTYEPAQTQTDVHTSRRAMARNGIAVFLIPTGTLLYMLINKMVTGDALKFLYYQKNHWFQSFGIFYNNIETMTVNAMEWDHKTAATLFIPQIVMIIGTLLLLLWCVNNKLRVSLVAYVFVYMIISISPTWLLSFPRYIFGAVPIFLFLAALGGKSKSWDLIISFVFVLTLSFLSVAFTNGMRVF